MKKIITAVLAGATVLTFAACSDNGGKPPENTNISEVTVTDKPVSVTNVTVVPEIATEAPVTELPETEAPVTTAATTATATAAPMPVITTKRPSDWPELSYARAELEALDNTKHGWGQGVHVDSMNRPTSCVSWQNTYGSYGGIYIMPETDPARLTFDLGYEFGCTGRILDTLNAKGVKGTFFVTMYYVKSCPDLVRRMIDEGHIVGNHSVNHLSMPDLSVADMEAEIMGLHEYVKENFGYEMYLFRPPMGEHSVRSLAAAQNLGYKSVLWSYAYYDYDTANQPSPADALALCTKNAHKGAVYLLHGISETNTAILGDFIDYLNTSGIGVANTW